MPKETPVYKTSGEVIATLRERYPSNAFAFLEQVGNATGQNQRRWADAIVMSLWPSRGLEIIGIEVKVSRSDWLSELRNPAKAEEIARHCDRFYLAIGDEGIVKLGELPPAWGLMVPSTRGIRVAKEAVSQFEGRSSIPRAFVAAILRQAQEQITDAAKIARLREVAFQEGRTAGLQAANASHESGVKYEREEKERLLKVIREFEAASGVVISRRFDSVEKIGGAVRTVLDGDARIAGFRQQVEMIKKYAETVAGHASHFLGEMPVGQVSHLPHASSA